MRRSPEVVLGMICMACVGLLPASMTLFADGPAKQAESVKPPWQRLLQGDDAKKAAEQEKQLAELQEAGKFEEALKAAETLAELRSKAQGADHWQVVDARMTVEALRRVLRQPQEARQEYVGSFALERQVETLRNKGRYREAQPSLEKILAIHRKVLGEEHSDTATSYNNLAGNLDAQGKYREAEESYRKALTICRKLLGEEHPHTAACYNSLAANQNAQGKHVEAEQGFRKVLAISREVLGEEHPATAKSYNALAASQYGQGKYREAEEGFRKALVIRRKVLGEEHPDTSRSFNNLATNLNAQGKYAEAEEGYRKALTILRKMLGEEHLDTAIAYNNVAYNLKVQGKYREAEEGYRKALAIHRKVLGDENPGTARIYNNMAGNWNAQGKYCEAEEGLRKALVISRKVLGEEHPDTARSYNNAALNLNAQGKYGEAEQGLRKALAIYRKVLGEEHPATATSYNNVAANLNVQGNYPEAEQSYRQGLAIYRKVLGEEHYLTAASYNNVAANLNAQGRYTEAEKHWFQAAESFGKVRLLLAAAGLERAEITSERSPFSSLAAVLARNGKPEDAWQRFEESLARGTWDDLSARLRQPPAQRAKQIQLVARLQRLDKLLGQTYAISKPTPEQTKRREELLTQQRQTQDELYDFARQMEKTYGAAAGQVFAREKIQAALPPDAALVGWLDVPGQPKAADPNGEHWAVLLRSTGPPRWLRLHGSGDKDAWTDADTRLPSELRAALQSARGPWQPLAERLRRQRLQPLTKHLQAGDGLPAVRHLIVLPSTALAGVPVEVLADKYTVSYAHSGTMHAHLRRLPTPTGKGLFALADPVFDTPAEKDKPQPLPPGGLLLTVVVPGSNAARAGLRPNDVLLRYGDTDLAGPADFKPQAESPDPERRVPVVVWREGNSLSRPVSVRPGKLGVVFASQPAPQALAEQRRLDRRMASRGDDGVWRRLPGTRCEVASLRRLFGGEPVQVLMDSDAGEQQLHELAQNGELGKYRYLHLATHGEVDNVAPLRSAVILSRDNLPDEKKRQELLLAGASIPDGRLTAEEVLQRWHLHSELVTLSACQTALGKYERGEGFVGFAQALILSGSRSVCLSLWKVDDAATVLLMERFYQNLLGKREGLSKPMSKAAALAESKAWLRGLSRAEAVARAARLSEGVARSKGRPELPLLAPVPAEAAEAKVARPYAHPYYWAAFVLIGDED